MDYNNLPGPDVSGPNGGEPGQNTPAPNGQQPAYPPNAPNAQPYQPPAPTYYPAQNAGQQVPPPPPPPSQQYYQPSPQQPVYPQPAPGDGKRGMAIASMVTGIVAVVMSILVSCALFLGLPCSIASIILGCVSLKSSGRGMAIAGIVCGAVAALILLMWLVLIVIGVSVGEGYYNYSY